ncbi:hypothetical protein DH2020_049776 [Rehmannia glutinosa]|uniref:Phospholipid-transporting ATPase n=1 Tax=Rehmannia glutinosa TaxID=99300 RepID=A0ABR0U1V2_REHGL
MPGWRGSGGGGDGAPSLEHISSSRTVRLGKVQPQAPGHRTVFCNDRDANALAKFKGNSVSTTKYDVFTFLPKGLFEQHVDYDGSRTRNIYTAGCGALLIQRVANLYFLMISILSCTPVSPVSPITNVLPLTMVLLVSLIKEAWEDWKRFQNDMSINNSTIEVLQDQKWVFTPWKKLQVGDIVKVKQDGFFPADILFLASTNADGVCYIETANLDGETNLKIRKASEKTWDYVTPEKVCEFKGEVQCEQPNNSLYTFTGCSLRNTQYIVGAVIFTGHETKVMMNSMKIPSKRSTLEKKLDKLILTLFSVLFCMCLLGAIGSGIFINRKYYYLRFDKSEKQFDPDNRFVMIKFIQSTQFINNDLHMYHAESNTPALARTSNLNEELGQVEYIFSDKTGTLTRNLMEFFKCSIGGEIYGTGVSEIELGAAQVTGRKVEVQNQSNAAREKGFNFDDARLMRGAWRNEPNPDSCKVVLPEGDESPEKIRYQAASPDESALVIAAKNFGFFFYNTRKRQSVVCRYPDGRLVLYCKGADTVIYERLVDGNNDLKRTTREHLEQFGASGLRTLCLAYRNLSPDVYENWNEKYIQAKSALRDREKKLDEIAELIEKDLILIGCTAIEDKLQEGVPQSCKLINNSMKQFIISSETDAIREIEDKGDQVELARFMKEIVKNELKRCNEEAQQYLHSASRPKLALCSSLLPSFSITESPGKFPKCLKNVSTSFDKLHTLYTSEEKLKPVKRQGRESRIGVTSLVKKGAKRITLSIGDGANDVSMIQAAHVGVGISGQEGMQAVMASDFAIAQFRFLTDLLLVHGRWSYHRICKVVTYFFYKNLTFTLTQFWFTFQTGFSGQRFYDDWFQSLYNVIFTALPVIIIGLFDKDVSAALSKKYPELYKEGIRNAFFKWRVVATWAFFAIYQSLVLYYFVVASSNRAMNSAGKMFGLWDVSTMAFTSVIVTENIYFVIYVLMSTFYFYFTLLLVPMAALFCDFIYLGVQRWFFPYDYQIVQEIHRDEVDNSRIGLLEIGNNDLTPDEARSYAIMQLPGQKSKHTGFAFDSPGYESFFASQAGVFVPQKAWDVARRASMRNRPKTPRKN